jgi:uncharacterized phage protein (TIGR01671 family)
MREIRFRAWTGEKMRPCSVSVTGKAMMDFGPSSAPLMQFTGLYDKSGTEIWEGDILADILEVEKGKPDYVYEVCWGDDIGPAWFGRPYYQGTPKGRCFLRDMNLRLYQVVGNIYEHLTLLQKPVS